VTDPSVALGFAPKPSGNAWADRHAELLVTCVGKGFYAADDTVVRLAQLDRLVGGHDEVKAMLAKAREVRDWLAVQAEAAAKLRPAPTGVPP
jgi:hypothetical protein